MEIVVGVLALIQLLYIARIYHELWRLNKVADERLQLMKLGVDRLAVSAQSIEQHASLVGVLLEQTNSILERQK